MSNDTNSNIEENKGYLSEEDFLNADLDAANAKVDGIVKEAVKAAVEKALADERAKGGAAKGGDDEVLTRQQIDEIAPDSLGVAVFTNDDDDIKDMANTLLKSELAKLPDNATRKQVKEAAAKVGQRIERLVGSKPPAIDDDDDPYKHGPVGTDTSGASEAHIKGAKPKTQEECEYLAMKIAASADAKWHKK